MWRRLKNLLLSVKTYSDLSPDFTARQQVKRALRDRSALTSEQWFQAHGRTIGVSPAIVTFVYKFSEQYTGLPFAKILPRDRLEADLRWTAVCWFDWQNRLCEDFEQAFGLELDELEAFAPTTIAEFLAFLDRQISTKRDLRQDADVEEGNL